MTAGPIAPYRIRPSVVRDGLAGQCGAENGPVVYARLVLAAGTHAAVAARAGAAESTGHCRDGSVDADVADAAGRSRRMGLIDKVYVGTTIGVAVFVASILVDARYHSE